MTGAEFRDRLASRAESVGLSIAADTVDRLEAYFRLLAQWNARINLTALPLERPADETIDRLLIEPLVAASYVETPGIWYDLGSGGGSPAIPFKIVHPRAKLTMVESRGKKAAFLREAVRTLELREAAVEHRRFEDVAKELPGTADLISVRAVRIDRTLCSILRQLMAPSGQTFLFHSPSTELNTQELEPVRTVEFGSPMSCLTILRPSVPRGTKY